ncbi:restriction endonuclease [Curtobacterium citreum]
MAVIDWGLWDAVTAAAVRVGPSSAAEFGDRFTRVQPSGMQVLTGADFALSSADRLVAMTLTIASAEHIADVIGRPLDADVHQAMAEEVAVTFAYASLLLLERSEYSEAEVSVVHEHARAADKPMAYVADDRADLERMAVRDDTLSRFEQVGGVAVPWVPHMLRMQLLRDRVTERRQASAAVEAAQPRFGSYQPVRRFPPKRSAERQDRIAELRARIESGERPPASVPASQPTAATPVPTDPAALHPREFELLVKELLEAMGLTAKETPYSKDDGVDVVAEDHRPFRRGRVVVQAKRYAGSVGVTTVRELNGVLPLHRAQRGIVVTTGTFTREAVATADLLGIELVDGAELRQALAEMLPR